MQLLMTGCCDVTDQQLHREKHALCSFTKILLMPTEPRVPTTGLWLVRKKTKRSLTWSRLKCNRTWDKDSGLLLRCFQLARSLIWPLFVSSKANHYKQLQLNMKVNTFKFTTHKASRYRRNSVIHPNFNWYMANAEIWKIVNSSVY